MATEIKHSFEGIPLLRSISTKTNSFDDVDITALTYETTIYSSILYDGYVYIDNTPYSIVNLIRIGFRRGLSLSNSTMILNCCNLSYGKWIVRNQDGVNINTKNYIDQEINATFVNYRNNDQIETRTAHIVTGIDIKSVDIYLSFNIDDLINYLNTTHGLSVNLSTSFNVYLNASIDDYNGILLYAGSD